LVQTYHHGRFEFFVAMIVIAIIALAALSRYYLMAEDAKIMRLQIISSQFMTGAANLRSHFLINSIVSKTKNQNATDISGQQFYFSEKGWPVSVAGPVANDYRPTEEDCYQLWMSLLQNPAPISKGAAGSQHEFRVFVQANNCRYEFSNGSAYFDYFPLDGKLIFISNGKNISTNN